MFQYTEQEVLPNNVMVFGCGGTGSRAIPPLLQLIKSQSWLLNPNIILIDGDEVEAKNTSRQNFILQDVGKNKAEVLASRYSHAFDMNIRFYPRYIHGTSMAGRTLQTTSSKDRGRVWKSPFNAHATEIHVDKELGNPHLQNSVVSSRVGMVYSFRGESSASSPMSDFEEMAAFLSNQEPVSDNARGSYREWCSRKISGRPQGSSDNVGYAEMYYQTCFAPVIAILCVDSAEARRKILSEINSVYKDRKVFVIDAGNEDIFGQVMFYRLDHRAPYLNQEEWNSSMVESILDPLGLENNLHSLPKAVRENLVKKDATSSIGMLASMPAELSLQRGSTHPVNFRLITQSQSGYEIPKSILSYNQQHDEVNDSRNGYLCWSNDYVVTQDMLPPEKNTYTSDEIAKLFGNVMSYASMSNHPRRLYQGSSSHLLPEMSSCKFKTTMLPCPDRLYDEMEEGSGTGSCADLDQTLAINNIMGGVIVSIVSNIVYSQPFDFHTVRVSLSGGYDAEKMNMYWMKGILSGTNRNYSSSLVRDFLDQMSVLEDQEPEFLESKIADMFFNRMTMYASLDEAKASNHNFYFRVREYTYIAREVLRKATAKTNDVVEAHAFFNLLHTAYELNPTEEGREGFLESVSGVAPVKVLADIYRILIRGWLTQFSPLSMNPLNGRDRENYLNTFDILSKVVNLAALSIDVEDYPISKVLPTYMESLNAVTSTGNLYSDIVRNRGYVVNSLTAAITYAIASGEFVPPVDMGSRKAS